MAGQDWTDWFEREELIGQISDIRVQNLQVEREVVQKRTFTRWMNLHLEKCNPPLMVHDLFRDIRDGRVLMALLEELSGCRLLHEFKPSAHRIFRLNNIARVLSFLEERNVKLVSIDAADITDGNSSIVLGLIWNIILFFQIKELTGNIRNQFPSTSSLSSIPTSSDSDMSLSSTPSDEKKPSVVARDHGKAIKTLLHWVQRRTRKYGVAVQDFGKSWTSGLAFLAVIKSIDPSLVDMRRAMLRSPRENIEEAFRTAHYSLGIPRLLEPEDITLNRPDEQSIMTYVSQFLEHFPGIEEDEPSNILERNKVSARMTELPVKNGVQRKREKSSVVKKDWVQPPPKIFISSVVKDQEQKRSAVPLQTVEDRPWDSEDSSVGSSPSTTENRPLSHSLGLNKDASSPLSSPQPSLNDSAMDFPESWAETPSELPQSCSNDSLRDSTSAGDLTSLGSPLESERGLQDQVESELFIDEGNFSLSLEARTTLLSEEEDAYRYILALKENETAGDVPNEDVIKNSHGKEPCLETNPDKPTSSDPSYGDWDSGYYPDQKDISTTNPDEVTERLLDPDTNKPIQAVVENEPETLAEIHKESLESFSTEPVQNILMESDQTNVFEDDLEWPVVQYERISISGSEEDLEELGTELCEEPLDEELVGKPEMLSGRMEDGAEEEDHSFKKTVEIDQVQEPEQDSPEAENKADQITTEYELPDIPTHRSQPGATDIEAEIQEKEEQKSGTEDSSKTEEQTMQDLRESCQELTDSLVETNFPEVEEENSESTSLKQSNKMGEIYVGDKTFQGDSGVGQEDMVTKSKLEDELNSSLPKTEVIPENGTIDEHKVENVIEDDASSSLENISVSATSSSNAIVSDIPPPEDFHEPNPGAPSCEEDEQSFSPLTTSAVAQTRDDENEGQAVCEESKIMDADRSERYRAELRLSLSVTPLQPAPSQPALTDSERAQEKVDYGVVESPGQSPFGLWVSHPGEWGLVETDLDAELERRNREEREIGEERQNREEHQNREERQNRDSARENTDTLRKEADSQRSTEDENQPLAVLRVPEVADVKEVENPRENGEAPAAITMNHADERCVMCNKKVCSPARAPQRADRPVLSEVDFLLLMWLLLYCLFVLPHMDIRTISRFLLNLDE
ncbi:calmin isoform X2 [Tachysurus fulvidraco]|uniref:calmin isoform X2 n=1 Tax=Tachysurus fulvidraco TaxID=1234273 RepID=UPI001FEE7334|nr:calmin isoform X2 [Tachysurus fulvidraco]